MQTNQSSQMPFIEVSTPNSMLNDPPKEYRSEASYSDSKTPAITDLPTPYNLNGDEKRASLRPNPHRKYSKKWFGYAYDTAVRVGKWPRITYAAVGIILITAWIGIMLAFAYDEVKYENKNANGDISRGSSSRITYDLFMKGTLRKFDPTERSLTVSWSMAYVDTDNHTLVDLGKTEDDRLLLNIYRDVRAVLEDRNSTPVVDNSLYRIDNITEVPIAVLGSHSWDSVTTEIDFAQAISGWAWTQPMFGYPFDRWTGSIVFAATARELAAFNNSYVVPISDAILTDSTFNWRIEAPTTQNTCLLPKITDGCELHIDFAGRRPGLVIFAAMVALVVNWTTTIGIFLITCESVVMQRNYILADTDLLGVCLTALFALPTVRSILPGAPDFGAVIDLIGIIPNVIIISICTTAIAIAKLRVRRPKENKDD